MQVRVSGQVLLNGSVEREFVEHFGAPGVEVQDAEVAPATEEASPAIAMPLTSSVIPPAYSAFVPA